MDLFKYNTMLKIVKDHPFDPPVARTKSRLSDLQGSGSGLWILVSWLNFSKIHAGPDPQLVTDLQLILVGLT